jgi:hypothetical protein
MCLSLLLLVVNFFATLGVARPALSDLIMSGGEVVFLSLAADNPWHGIDSI